MPIIYLIIPMLAFFLWVGMLILDNYAYQEYLRKLEAKKRKAKEAEKKRNIKLKWPENVPRQDLYL